MVAADQPAVLGGFHPRGAGRRAGVSEAWRPYRTWAAVHLRGLREQRTGEIAGR